MRLLRGCAIVLLFLALFFGGIYAVEDWRGARAWDAAVREVKEHGGTTDFASVIPPPIPDDQNLAMAPFFVKALNYQIDPETKQLTFGPPLKDPLLDHMPFGPNNTRFFHPHTSDWQQGRAANLGAWQTYFRGDPGFPQASDEQSPADAVTMALSRYKTPLDEVAAAAAARPRSRFSINWTAPNIFLISLPEGSLLHRLAAALSIRASAEAVSGKQADAVADIALGFRLSEALDDDPVLVNDVESKGIIGMMAQPIWDGLAARSWDAGQLQGLQTLLSRQDALASSARAVRTEEASATRQMEDLEQHSDSRAMYFDPIHLSADYPPTHRENLFSESLGIIPKGWYDQNKSRIVRFQQKYVLAAIDPARRRVFPSIIAAGKAECAATSFNPYTLFFRSGDHTFESILLRAARKQVSCDQAAIACALERYSLDHQSYPNDLGALTPAYLTKVPTDVIDGAPMRYQRAPDGRYRLYSIGWNARDDGGKAARIEGGTHPDERAGDWVWQYEPIKPPEFRQN